MAHFYVHRCLQDCHVSCDVSRLCRPADGAAAAAAASSVDFTLAETDRHHGAGGGGANEKVCSSGESGDVNGADVCDGVGGVGDGSPRRADSRGMYTAGDDLGVRRLHTSGEWDAMWRRQPRPRPSRQHVAPMTGNLDMYAARSVSATAVSAVATRAGSEAGRGHG